MPVSPRLRRTGKKTRPPGASARRLSVASPERHSARAGRSLVDRRRSARTGSLPASALLQLMWLASPALPVGGFSYSEALEAAVEAGLVTTETQANRWLQDQLALNLARSELPVLAKAFGAWRRGDRQTITELNAWVLCTRESAEMRQQTEQMGRSLLAWLNNHRAPGAAPDIAPDTAPDTASDSLAALQALSPAPTWPVAFALAGQHTGAPLRDVMLGFAFGWAENMVQAALKAVPLGQGAGQRILATLTGVIPAAVDQAIALSDSERMAFTPMLAILSAQHETQYSRLFRS